MNPFVLLLIGMLIVVGGILAFRLHAFLALILAALSVGALTPEDTVKWHERTSAGDRIRGLRSSDAQTGNDIEFSLAKHTVDEGATLFAFDGNGRERPEGPKARLRVEKVEGESGGKKQKLITARVLDGRVDDGDYVAAPSEWNAAASAAKQTVAERVAGGFGDTAAKIGILIAMAAIIGKCLLDSGAADRIVRSALKLLGEARAAVAFIFSGFLLGIPVFFDTVFYLMIPLGKALRLRTGKNYLLYVLTIVAGASMAHSLVPPTPGPLLVAGELGVDLGTMILGGCIVGVFTAVFGYFYAHWINGRVEIPLRDSPDFSLEELRKASAVDESRLPPLWLSLAPILLPVVLIAGGTILSPKIIGVELPPAAQTAVTALSNKNIALILAAAVALLMLVAYKKPTKEETARTVQSALASGGVIILITSAGGAFGQTLKQTGIGEYIAANTPETNKLLVLPLAFGITTLVRTAQGSATVAMITAVGILAPVAAATDLGYHDVYVALAIGCGSKPIAWMNDSGFWVISKMSGMTEAETLKTLTPMTACMGVVGLAVVMLGAVVWPM